MNKTQVKLINKNIENNFKNFYNLLEMVDPQLKNNQDLVELLQEYECAWEKGKHYFTETNKCNHLIHFSHILEITTEKHQ